MVTKEIKKICDGIKNENLTINDLVTHCLNTMSINEAFSTLANYIYNEYIQQQDEEPIVIDREDFEKIVSLFKIRGERIVDGEIVAEKRGRKKKLLFE